MTEIEALRAEVSELRRELADLRRSGVTVIHNHYHDHAPRTLGPYVAPPYYPGGPFPNVCGGQSGAEWPNLRMAYSDPRLTGAACCQISPIVEAVATYHPPG